MKIVTALVLTYNEQENITPLAAAGYWLMVIC